MVHIEDSLRELLNRCGTYGVGQQIIRWVKEKNPDYDYESAVHTAHGGPWLDMDDREDEANCAPEQPAA